MEGLMTNFTKLISMSLLALSLSGCAVTNGTQWASTDFLPTTDLVKTAEGRQELARNFQNSRKCRFVIKSVENSSSQSVTVLAGPKRDARNVYKESSVFASSGDLVTLDLRNQNSQGFANPGQVIYGKILKTGQQTRIVPIGRMPNNCDSRSDNTQPDLYLDIDVREFSGRTFLLPF